MATGRIRYRGAVSGPIDDVDTTEAATGVAAIEIREGRTTTLGGTAIMRVLPTKRRRTIGPWCFTDLIRPDEIENPPPLEIGPHPHIGLATVTWLFAGSVLHTDSMGTEQPIRPGELNLMTVGLGASHAEEGLEVALGRDTGGIMGAQMWLAQPEATRNGPGRFEHHPDLPRTDAGGAEAHVFIGSWGDAVSPAVADHDALGMDVTFDRTAMLPLDATFEHGVIPINRPITVDGEIVDPGSVAYMPSARSTVELGSRSGPARCMIVGGTPLPAPITVWWNFVAQSKEEITVAWRDWRTDNVDRFGRVATSLPRIEAPRPPWLTAD